MNEKKTTHVYAVYQGYGAFDSMKELYREKEDAEKGADKIRAFGIRAHVMKLEVR